MDGNPRGVTRRQSESFALDVRERLEFAGFEASLLRDPYAEEPAGVVLEVPDSDADERRIVVVRWSCGAQMRHLAAESAAQGRVDSDEIRDHGKILDVMREALKQALTTLGYSVRNSKDDLQPYAIEVFPG
jgi:hypothetical protein